MDNTFNMGKKIYLVYNRTNSAHMKNQLVTNEVKWFLNYELNVKTQL